MAAGGLIPRRSDLVVAGFLAAISWIAAELHLPYVLFPELGALTWVIVGDPRHPWARSPALLLLTPLLTGVVGLSVSQLLPYGPLAVLLAVGGSLLVVVALRSPIAPALSAGLLPLALDIRSWAYPFALLIGTGGLALLSHLRRQPGWPWRSAEGFSRAGAALAQAPFAPGSLRSWGPVFAVFLLGGVLLARWLGSPLVLFPPLLVIAFDRLAHRRHCRWRRRPGAMLVTANSAALVGLLLVLLLGVTPWAVFLASLLGASLLRRAHLFFPPAMGMTLLPFVIPRPPLSYPLLTLAGCLWLLVVVGAAERLGRRGRASGTA